MKNTVIKGTGNSRTLKIPPGSVTVYQSVYDLVHAMETGNFSIDIGPLNPAGCEQIGDNLDKETLLKDSTAELLGLDNTAVPNDALMALYAFSKGMAQIRVTVKDASGNPFSNIPVTGLSDVLGNTPVFTNENGVAVGYSMSGSKSFSTANILDITSVSKTVSVSAGGIYDVELVPARRNFIRFDSSANVYISNDVDTVDISAVSAGENGQNGTVSYPIMTSGRGGASGSSTIEYGVDASAYAGKYAGVVVGAPSGGTSSFLGVEAKLSSTVLGGSPVTGNSDNSKIAVPGKAGSTSNYQYFTSFTEVSNCGGAGGGGAVSGSDVSGAGGPGGAPHGGRGGTTNPNGPDSVGSATGPGGGGGGGSCKYKSGNNGGTGYKGVVSVRIHFKEGITV